MTSAPGTTNTTTHKAWRMPAETDPHACTWMAFPTKGYTLGETAAEAQSARASWANVANAVARFEPVRMVIDPSDRSTARALLDPSIELIEAPLDDAWMRDIGPTFVLDEHGALGAVDWSFNGWGAQSWAAWDRDAQIGSVVANIAGATLVDSPIVNEGGAIHVDGAGTVLLTKTVQLDPGRNPGVSAADIEAELRRTLGVDTFIWIERGLTRDYDEFGTRGHVDIVATFPRPGQVLVHTQSSPEHPDFAVSRSVLEQLAGQRDSAGNLLEIVEIPAPATLFDDEGPVDYSYVNHLVVNGGVVACRFEDANDERAVEVLRSVYPGREVVSVDARELFARGGGIHCITQQQPVSTESSNSK